MLKNTFIHIPGIGAITEQRLWNSGITDWNTPFDNAPVPISSNRKITITNGIVESKQHLERCNPSFFSDQLPANQCWRLFPEFRKSTVYLDIETTGMDRGYNDITTIALYDGTTIQTYIHGQNLDDFVDDIQKYNVIVSYNGKCFDVPFIESYFGIQLNHTQIDLRYFIQMKREKLLIWTITKINTSRWFWKNLVNQSKAVMWIKVSQDQSLVHHRHMSR